MGEYSRIGYETDRKKINIFDTTLREVNFQWKVFISGYYEDKKILNKNTHNIHVYKSQGILHILGNPMYIGTHYQATMMKLISNMIGTAVVDIFGEMSALHL